MYENLNDIAYLFSKSNWVLRKFSTMGVYSTKKRLVNVERKVIMRGTEAHPKRAIDVANIHSKSPPSAIATHNHCLRWMP